MTAPLGAPVEGHGAPRGHKEEAGSRTGQAEEEARTGSKSSHIMGLKVPSVDAAQSRWFLSNNQESVAPNAGLHARQQMQMPDSLIEGAGAA